MALVVPQPSAFSFKVQLGEVFTGHVQINNALTDRAVVVSAEGNGLVVLGVERSRQIRIPYSEEELREFPPAIRERLRREGKIEMVVDGSFGPGVPFEVERGGTVLVRFEARAAAGPGNVTSTKLVFEGAVWGRVEIPVVPVIGRGNAAVSWVPDRLRVAVAPGQTVVRDVIVHRAPVEAQVVAVLDSMSSAVRVSGLVALRYEHRNFTEEELLELPPAMREQARRNGYEETIVVGRAEGGQSLTVPTGGMLQVSVAFTVPASLPANGFVDLSGTLVVESNNWQRISVPIASVAGAVGVELSTERVELGQGEERDGPMLSLRCFSGPATEVALTLGLPGDPWTLQPTLVALPARGSATAQLRIAAAGSAATGEQRADLRLVWFDGLGDLTIPLTMAVRPGPVSVFVLLPNMVGLQGSTVGVTLRVNASSAKLLEFFPEELPAGVHMLPAERQHFDAGIRDMPLRFQLDRYARPFENQRIVVGWRASDHVNAGRLEMRLSLHLLREEKLFSAPVVTPDGIPLGGRVELLLANDGSGRFRGQMRATGLPSFQFHLVAVVRSASGLVAVAEQQSGAVFGSDSFGNREFRWDRPLESPLAAPFLRDHWPGILSGNLAVNRAFEFRGIVGTLLDRLHDMLDLLAGLAVLAPVVPGAPALTALVLAGSELSELTGVHLTGQGAGGLAGVITAAGSAFIFGPSVILPAFVAGAAAGELVIRHREVEPHEQQFAERVFGATLPWNRIRLTNLAGANGRAFVCPNADNLILVNLGDLFDNPTTRHTNSYPVNGQLFVHELVHAWQIEHLTLDTTFLWRGIIDKLTGGDYGYGLPDRPFSSFGIEQQASLVEEWFSGTVRHASISWAGRKPMDNDDRYFHYIADNIRLGRT